MLSRPDIVPIDRTCRARAKCLRDVFRQSSSLPPCIDWHSLLAAGGLRDPSKPPRLMVLPCREPPLGMCGGGAFVIESAPLPFANPGAPACRKSRDDWNCTAWSGRASPGAGRGAECIMLESGGEPCTYSYEDRESCCGSMVAIQGASRRRAQVAPTIFLPPLSDCRSASSCTGRRGRESWWRNRIGGAGRKRSDGDSILYLLSRAREEDLRLTSAVKAKPFGGGEETLKAERSS